MVERSVADVAHAATQAARSASSVTADTLSTRGYPADAAIGVPDGEADDHVGPDRQPSGQHAFDPLAVVAVDQGEERIEGRWQGCAGEA